MANLWSLSTLSVSKYWSTCESLLKRKKIFIYMRLSVIRVLVIYIWHYTKFVIVYLLRHCAWHLNFISDTGLLPEIGMNIYKKCGIYENEVLIIVLYHVQFIASFIIDIGDLYLILVEIQRNYTNKVTKSLMPRSLFRRRCILCTCVAGGTHHISTHSRLTFKHVLCCDIMPFISVWEKPVLSV